MNLHEYQAREVLSAFAIPFPPGHLVHNLDELKTILKSTQWQKCVLKAQIHSGARGKAGAVKLAASETEALKIAQAMLGKTFVTHQTGPIGKTAYEILVCPLTSILKEFYVGLTIDRNRGRLVLLASASGGIDIESQKPTTLTIPLKGMLRSHHKLELAKLFALSKEASTQLEHILDGLCKAFTEIDASLIEINPLVLTQEGELVALDAKVAIDDNALFRQTKIKVLDDPRQQSPLEVSAKSHDLAYVAMQGEVGCMVNGAGLAMATMDALALNGARAANFLDVGGSADEERIAAGFDILSQDPQVKAILVNIFGGIMNCQTLATGILKSLKNRPLKVPLVVRMEGNHSSEGLGLLSESGLNLAVAHHLQEAAVIAAQLAKGGAF